MPKKKKGKCSNCYYWRKDIKWSQKTFKVDKREMGFCLLEPPKLMQNIVPSIIREQGLSVLKENSEKFQFRPATESKDYCKFHEKK